MLTAPLGSQKMHARRNVDLSIASGRLLSASGLSHGNIPSGGLSPRFPPSMARHLLGASPPPSPALPSLVPRHGKRRPSENRRQIKEFIVTFALFAFLVWMVVTVFSYAFAASRHTASPPQSERARGDDAPAYEMVGDSALPDEPSVVVVRDSKGKERWTVSIPSKHSFPLWPAQYKELCLQAEEVSASIYTSQTGKSASGKRESYYDVDSRFLDVEDAESQGLLEPKSKSHQEADKTICKRSLTYVLESDDAGLGASLMGLWVAYGLARKEGRTFFVDDTRWAYGNYSTYFRPPPLPQCAPPPPSHRLPCPHSAAHLVVSAVTADRTFGNSFLTATSTIRSRHFLGRQSLVYKMAREGYEALFHLADAGDRQYLTGRNQERINKAKEDGGMTVGIHVRRGARRPWEYQYMNDYLPLIHFRDEARRILGRHIQNGESRDGFGAFWKNLFGRSSHTGQDQEHSHDALTRLQSSSILLASDDPDVYDAPEFSQVAVRAQDHIVLASKAVLDRVQREGGGDGSSRNAGFVDEVHGWEGGFFRDLFWKLGREKASVQDADKFSSVPVRDRKVKGSTKDDAAAVDGAAKPSEAALGLRTMVGRAYLLDLAVLAGSDAVVCAVSATGCRLLAVMMGPDKVAAGRWRNVDGSFPWTGVT